MSKKAILHISDLHITDFSSKNIESWVKPEKMFYEVFYDTLEETLTDNDASLDMIMITGDLANEALKREYDNVLEFLNVFSNRFRIEKDKIIIVPGNHDINWIDQRKEYEDKVDNEEIVKPETLDIKYAKFEQFYKKFYDEKKEFPKDKTICSKFINEDIKLLAIGINTNLKESFEKHEGYIDYNTFKNELDELCEKYKDYYKVAMMHHKPMIGDIKERGSITNWKQIKEIFRKKGVRTFFYGHVHSNQIMRTTQKEVREYVGVGSFAKKCFDEKNERYATNSFNILILDESESSCLKFKTHTFHFTPDTEVGRYGVGYWSKMPSEDINREVIITKQEKSEEIIPNKPADLIGDEDDDEFETEMDNFNGEENKGKREKDTYDESILTKMAERLIEIVRSNNLLKSGHFHWNKELRCNTWIDTNYLLSRNEYLSEMVTNFIKLIRSYKINHDIMIGLGMEGNILGAAVSLAFDSQYTYTPILDERKNEYNDYEIKMQKGAFKKAIILTDSIFKGNKIRSLLESNKKYFEDFDEINIMSIFYVGNEEYSTSMLSSIDKRIKYFSICKNIKISECIYKNIEDCPIHKNKLVTVYNFYNNEEE